MVSWNEQREKLEEISREFKVNKYSSVSSLTERMKREISKSQGLRKRVEELEAHISKGSRADLMPLWQRALALHFQIRMTN